MADYLKNILEFNRELSFAGLTDANFGKLKNIRRPDGLVICGLGGSGLPGMLFKDLAKKAGLKTPVVVWKSFGLPKHNFKKPFYIFISFSGKTAETLSGLKFLVGGKSRFDAAAITSGGELKKIAQRNGLPLVSFKAGRLTPREALGIMYYGLNKVLHAAGLCPKAKDLSSSINPKTLVSFGRKFAKQIHNKIPLIYTDAEHRSLGYLWKTNLNETGKQPAFTNFLPEADHNEINAFENRKFSFVVLFLTDQKQPKQILDKFKATKKVLAKNRVRCLEIKLRGKNEEEKAWNSIVLSHLTAFYLAKLNKTNPTQIRLIDQLKKLTR